MKLSQVVLPVLAIALLGAGACFRNDIRTVDFDVPQLKSDACTSHILAVLNSNAIEGVKAVVPKIEERKLSVSYDSTRLAIKNIEFLIAKAGFDANTTKATADARAKLPPECQ